LLPLFLFDLLGMLVLLLNFSGVSGIRYRCERR
jgi:hypothetical protein